MFYFFAPVVFLCSFLRDGDVGMGTSDWDDSRVDSVSGRLSRDMAPILTNRAVVGFIGILRNMIHVPGALSW